MDNNQYRKKVIWLIISFSLFRLIFASILELGNDESYYWVYSQYLQWNYFDHPPMVALWTRIFSFNLYLQDFTLFLRLGSVISCAIASWILFKLMGQLVSVRSGLFAVILYNASFYSGLTAGLLIMPDAPQMIFWILSLLMITKVINFPDIIKWWILLGLAIGLSIMSKVHGVYIWVGLGLYILISDRKLLKNKGLYIALLITAIVVSPIIIWNIKNDFVTYRFHSERIIIHGYLFNINNFFKEFILEFFVNNPIVVVLIIWAYLNKKKLSASINPAFRVFQFIGISLIVVVLFLSLFRDTRPIWSGPGFVSLIPFTAFVIDSINLNKPRKVAYAALALFPIIVIGICIFLNFYPGTYGSKISSELGKGDISLDMYGWEEAGRVFQSLYTKDSLEKKASPLTPVICNNWWGAHEEFYFCRPTGLKMIGLGNTMDLHQYIWTNKRRYAGVNFSTAYCIIHSDENYNIREKFKDYYSTIDSLQPIKIFRNGLQAHTFYIFRLTGWKNHLPVVY